MGVVIETCVKHPGGRTRKKGADISEAQAGAGINTGTYSAVGNRSWQKK
jgi:hypothetical protein